MKTFQVSIGEMGSFRAKPGENLLDAALMNGIDMPHDCRSGTCGSCRCTLSSGSVEGGETDSPGAVLACQAKVVSDLEIIVEETPPVETFGATKNARPPEANQEEQRAFERANQTPARPASKN